MKPGTTMVAFQLPAAALAQVRALAAARTPAVSVSHWLREAVEEKIKREKRAARRAGR